MVIDGSEIKVSLGGIQILVAVCVSVSSQGGHRIVGSRIPSR